MNRGMKTVLMVALCYVHISESRYMSHGTEIKTQDLKELQGKRETNN
jgi:hypothetical protein